MIVLPQERASNAIVPLLTYLLPFLFFFASPLDLSAETQANVRENASRDVSPTALYAEYCGPDSLWFALMRLGKEDSIANVRRHFVGSQGTPRLCSIGELQEVAGEYGVFSSVLLVDREGLRRLGECVVSGQFQAIMYVPTREGHFVPVVWADSHTLHVLDVGTMASYFLDLTRVGADEEMAVLLLSNDSPPRRELRRLSGTEYVSRSRLTIGLTILLGGGFVAGLLIKKSSSCRRSKSTPASNARSCD